MDKVSQSSPEVISATKLRLGVIFLFLWWIPFWLAAPGLNKLLGITSPEGQHMLLLFILGLQTIFFFLGLLMCGRQTVNMARKAPKKQVPKLFWRTLRHGQINLG